MESEERRTIFVVFHIQLLTDAFLIVHPSWVLSLHTFTVVAVAHQLAAVWPSLLVDLPEAHTPVYPRPHAIHPKRLLYPRPLIVNRVV